MKYTELTCPSSFFWGVAIYIENPWHINFDCMEVCTYYSPNLECPWIISFSQLKYRIKQKLFSYCLFKLQ